jgi:hypothetical protein
VLINEAVERRKRRRWSVLAQFVMLELVRQARLVWHVELASDVACLGSLLDSTESTDDGVRRRRARSSPAVRIEGEVDDDRLTDRLVAITSSPRSWTGSPSRWQCESSPSSGGRRALARRFRLRARVARPRRPSSR